MTADEFNKQHDILTDVIVTDDFGIKHERKTTSKAWVLGCGISVINCEDFRAYDLERIKPINSAMARE